MNFPRWTRPTAPPRPNAVPPSVQSVNRGYRLLLHTSSPVTTLLSASPVSQTSWPARNRGRFRLSVLFPVLLSLAVPATAWGDIYKWTDETGGTHFSNFRPDKSVKAKDVEVVIK